MREQTLQIHAPRSLWVDPIIGAEDVSLLRAKHAIAVKALGSLSIANDQRDAKLKAAEQAVVNAVDQIFVNEEVAKAVQHPLAEAAHIGKELLFVGVADELTGGRLRRRQRLLGSVPRPGRD